MPIFLFQVNSKSAVIALTLISISRCVGFGVLLLSLIMGALLICTSEFALYSIAQVSFLKDRGSQYPDKET